MSILKINDLQAAQTEGYISELTETEMTVMGGCGHCGGSLISVNDSFNNNNISTQGQGIGYQASQSPTNVALAALDALAFNDSYTDY